MKLRLGSEQNLPAGWNLFWYTERQDFHFDQLYPCRLVQQHSWQLFQRLHIFPDISWISSEESKQNRSWPSFHLFPVPFWVLFKILIKFKKEWSYEIFHYEMHLANLFFLLIKVDSLLYLNDLVETVWRLTWPCALTTPS